MADTEALDVYLNDHLAGAAAAVELVERLRASNEGSALATHLGGLGRLIEEDRDTLAAVMEQLGVVRSAPKQMAGKVLETLSRLRLSERVTGNAHVTRLMELETLSLGIEAKLALWRSLGQVTSSRPDLAGLDLPALEARAVDQRTGLEPYRLEAASQAFAAPEAGA
jgi:DNA-binding FrmR family transcriptional regulator